MAVKISLKKQTLHFHRPFKISYEQASQEEIVFLQLTDSEGRVGLASGSCDESVTGETPGKLLKILQKKLAGDFFDRPLKNLSWYHQKIQKAFKGRPVAQATVEIAILNLWSKQSQTSLWRYFGGRRKSCPLVFSIGIKSLNKTLEEAGQKIKEGYRLIKLKAGLNLSQDITKVLMVSRLMPKNSQLLVDLNQGYSFSRAKEFIARTRASRLALVEQPVKAGDWASLKKLSGFSAVPVIADESAVSFNDCQKLLKGNYVDGVNVKLMKCGGPLNFLEIYRLAKKLNKLVMIGCMYESVVSLTTSAQLALGLQVDYADLDSGPIDFYDDPASGGVVFKKGRLLQGPPLTASNLWPN